MTEISIGAPHFRTLLKSLEANTERGAALYLQHDTASNRFLIQEIEIADAADIVSANEIEITFAPEFLTRVTRRARERKQHMALLHTHPNGAFEFSGVGVSLFMLLRNPNR